MVGEGSGADVRARVSAGVGVGSDVGVSGGATEVAAAVGDAASMRGDCSGAAHPDRASVNAASAKLTRGIRGIV